MVKSAHRSQPPVMGFPLLLVPCRWVKIPLPWSWESTCPLPLLWGLKDLPVSEVSPPRRSLLCKQEMPSLSVTSRMPLVPSLLDRGLQRHLFGALEVVPTWALRVSIKTRGTGWEPPCSPRASPLFHGWSRDSDGCEFKSPHCRSPATSAFSS